MTYASDQQTSQSGSPFWRGVGRVFKVLLRILLVLIFGVLIGAGLYYGVPWAYRTVIRPVQENRVRIVALEQSLEQERTRLQDEAATLRERATDLEMAVTELRETSGVQGQQLADLDTHAAELQAQLDSLAERMDGQEAAMASFESELNEEMASLETELDEEITALETDLAAELETEVGAALEEVDKRYADIQTQANTLEGRLALIQAAQDLLKVRLLLLEENPRAARETVTLTIDHLTRARALMPAQTPALTDLETRLENLDELIAQDSFRVGPELEALWAEVMDMVLPPASALPTPVPTRTPWETPTSTSPIPTPTQTPEP